MQKVFIVPKDIIAKSAPMGSLGVNLKSYFKTDLDTSFGDPRPYSKTQDFETTGGMVSLVHENPLQVKKDVAFLRDLEKRAFQLVLSEEIHEDKDIDDNEICEEITSLIDHIRPLGTCLLVTENAFDGLTAYQSSVDELDEVQAEFDGVIVNLNKSLVDMNDDEIARQFLKIFDKVKFGGVIFIPKTTYEFMPNSRLGAEALLKLLDFKIELPMHNLNRMVIATKR